MAIGVLFDWEGGEVYYYRDMRPLIHNGSVVVALLLFAGAAVATEDLDAALAAQKKKAQRRVYSERAVLDDQALTVPKEANEEEQALDRKLREMDAQADAAVRITDPAMFRPAAPAISLQPVAENQNWLTPAVLDSSTAAELPSDGDSWLEHQKIEKERAAQLQEQETVNRLVREKAQPQPPQNTFPELDSLKQYHLPPPSTGLQKESLSAPQWTLPATGTAPSQPARQIETDRPQMPLSLFSQLTESSAPLIEEPLQQNKPVTFESPFSKPAAQFSPGLNSPSEPAAPSPLQRIKQSSPINQANPFADDPMPQFKNSIWE